VRALPFSEIRATFPVLGKPGQCPPRRPDHPGGVDYAFTNTLSQEQSQAAYDRYAVPVSGRMLFQGGFANLAILPPAVQRENYDKNVKHSTAVTAYKLFPGRDHCTCGEDGWEAVADLALGWALDPRPCELG